VARKLTPEEIKQIHDWNLYTPEEIKQIHDLVGSGYLKIARQAAAKLTPRDTDGDILRNAPWSLMADANRIYLDRVLELFIRIRRDCDAAAAEYRDQWGGRALKDDDGLAAVEFLAIFILRAVRQEREQLVKPPRRKSGQHERTRNFKADWMAIYETAKQHQRATPKTLTRWIAALDENLRLGATDSGKKISFQEAEQIRLYRDRFEQRRVALLSGKIKRPSRDQIRDRIAEQFVKTGLYGKPRKGRDARTYIDGKYKRARAGVRKRK
jgi:hypothetical protein